MVKKVLFLAILLVLVVSMVDAQEFSSKIRVKTYPNHDVYLSIMDPMDPDTTFSVLSSSSDKYGDAFFIFTSDDPDEFNFDLRVIVKKGDSRVYPKTGKGEYFEENYILGSAVDIWVGPEDYEFILTPGVDDVEEAVDTEEVSEVLEEEVVLEENETLVEEETVVEEVIESGEVVSTGTGFSISDLGTSPIAYGVVAVLFIGGAMIFLIIGRRQKRKKNRSFNVNNSSPVVSSNDLVRAEAKLRDAQREVQRIKNEERIKETRARIAAEEAELRRLRSGQI